MPDVPEPSRPTPLSTAKRCTACGYDLRGSDSDRRPECGAARTLAAITIRDAGQYQLAKAALEHNGLLANFMDPGGTLGPLTNFETGLQIPGWLWVDQTRLDRAAEILDDLGIFTSINARPIVDRSEPLCPRCGARMDTSGPEVCPACRAQFTWVDIDDADPL